MNRRTSILTAVVITLLLALPVLAADKPGEGTKFFMNYRAAFQEAKAVEELFPFLSKERISQVEKTPKQDRVKMFELMKMMDMKNVKVTKETETATGYTLEATGEGGMEGGPSKGTIRIVDKSPTCTCPLVRPNLTPQSFCDCTLGWQKEVYSAVAGRPVEATVEESILRGGKKCVFRIQIL